MVVGGSSNIPRTQVPHILASSVPDLLSYFEIKPIAKIMYLINVVMVVQLVNLHKLSKELHVRS